MLVAVTIISVTIAGMILFLGGRHVVKTGKTAKGSKEAMDPQVQQTLGPAQHAMG